MQEWQLNDSEILHHAACIKEVNSDSSKGLKTNFILRKHVKILQN